MSCKDLGNGDCEGWMWHQKERTGLVPKSWRKYWFKLKDRNLYCYKDPRVNINSDYFTHRIPTQVMTDQSPASQLSNLSQTGSTHAQMFVH